MSLRKCCTTAERHFFVWRTSTVRVARCPITLDVSWNNLGAEGGKAMAEALKVNAVLTSLDISDKQDWRRRRQGHRRRLRVGHGGAEKSVT